MSIKFLQHFRDELLLHSTEDVTRGITNWNCMTSREELTLILKAESKLSESDHDTFDQNRPPCSAKKRKKKHVSIANYGLHCYAEIVKLALIQSRY